MKSNPWLLSGLATLAAVSVLAQTNKPAAARKEASTLAKDVVLDPPASATVKQESVNVRGQPSFTGEVVAHVHKGETVSVLEEMTLRKPTKGEPANWSRILLPTNTAVWVFRDYVDTKTMTISARRINVRGGPGENYSVIARLEKGTPVKEIKRAQGWIQIEPPANAYGFMASEYLTMQPPTAPPPGTPVTTEPVVAAPVATPPPTAPPPTPTPEPVAVPAPVAAPIVAPEPVSSITPPPAPTEPAPVAPKPHVVTREGFVRKALNIQAPTDYELRDIQTGDVIEYLQAPDKNFKTYLNSRVSVTGAEVLDARWPKTPVLQVETIDLLP